MSDYEIIPGKGKVKKTNNVFGCGIAFSDNTEKLTKKPSVYEKTKAQVYATGNKWAIENFNATHG